MRYFIIICTLVAFTTVRLNAARFLFDYTKDETAGNADWIIDGQYPYPQPSNPTSPTDWDRALSSWGYALYTMGHEVVTLPPDSAISYGTNHDLDLSNFDVFVMVEPQNPLSQSEVQAIVNFVQNGGGFLMVSDHYGSDRNNNGWDSPRVLNDAFEDVFGVHFDTTGEPNNSISDTLTNVSTAPNDSIIQGPVGIVDTFGYWGGDVCVLRTSINSSLKGHIWKNGVAQDTTDVIVFTGTYGNGKIGGFGDSSPCDDGTGDPSDNLHSNWYDYQDSTLILNLCLWLAHTQIPNTPPSIDTVIQTPSVVMDTDTVKIEAYITDDHAVNTDSLYYAINSGTYTAIPHYVRSNDTSYFKIDPQNYDDTVFYYVIAIDDSGARTVSDTFSYTVKNHRANNPPQIDNLWHEPASPTDTDTAIVYAIITDDHAISTDSLYVSLNNGSYSPYYHDSMYNDTFKYTIGTYSEGTNVSYYVVAIDDSGARTVSDTLSYTVQSSHNQLNAGVVINEIMYNPSTSWGDDAYFEYTEVWNATPDTIDMTGWYLMDNTRNKVAHVPDGTKVPPYYFVVFARNVDSLLSKAAYQPYLTNGNEILINIKDSVQLSNGGEWVKLVDNNGNTVDSVSYDDSSPWPTAPDGNGPSLELKDPNIDNNDPSNWAASGSTKTADYGTPGDTNSVYVATYVKEHSRRKKAFKNRVIIMNMKSFSQRYMENAKYDVYDIKGQRIKNKALLRKGAYFVVPLNNKTSIMRFLIMN